MSDLPDFARQIEERIASLENHRHLVARSNEDLMRERESHVRRFQFVGESVHRLLIQPRLDLLRGAFDNISIEHVTEAAALRTVCRFEHTDQFPATTRLMVSLKHDPESDLASMAWDLEIIPILMSFDSHGSLEFSLERPDEALIAAWLEEVVLGFLQTYLQLPTNANYQVWNTHRDPVCGMVVTGGDAPFKRRVGTKTYYFCSAICCDTFAASPSFYLPAAAGSSL
jgi:YHS domain-containing protein